MTFRRIGDVLGAEYGDAITSFEKLQSQIREQRIEQYGFDAECDCHECGDTGTNPEIRRPCWCDAGRRIVQLESYERKWLETMPKRFQKLRLDTHPDKTSVGIAKRWIEKRYRQGGNLILTGSVGTGKTGLASSIAREILFEGDVVVFETLPVLLSKLRPRGNMPSEIDIDAILAAHLLVVDDIGTERLTDWGMEQVTRIISERHGEELPVIITTNLSYTGIVNELGERIASRLYDGATVVPMSGDDLRQGGR